MEQTHWIVTTGLKSSGALTEAARKAAASLGGCFVLRGNHSLATLKAQYQVNRILLATKRGWVLHTPEGGLFFHLNMAHLRIKNLRSGDHDNMAEAMGLRAGMSVLDCTLGLGSDAVISSFIVQGGGRVVGLEISPSTAWIVKEGLKTFHAEDEEIRAALERIEVIQADYSVYLQAQPANSFDIVYFDPMFRRPIQESVHLKPLRFVADHRPLNCAALAAAKRVARQRVVIKEANGSREFERLGVSYVAGGKYSSVQYGVIDANES